MYSFDCLFVYESEDVEEHDEDKQSVEVCFFWGCALSPSSRLLPFWRHSPSGPATFAGIARSSPWQFSSPTNVVSYSGESFYLTFVSFRVDGLGTLGGS